MSLEPNRTTTNQVLELIVEVCRDLAAGADGLTDEAALEYFNARAEAVYAGCFNSLRETEFWQLLRVEIPRLSMRMRRQRCMGA